MSCIPVKKVGHFVLFICVTLCLLLVRQQGFVKAQDDSATNTDVDTAALLEIEPTWTPFVVTSTPTPINVFVAAAHVLEATEQARVIGTATPTPPNMVTATATPTFIIVTNTSTPINGATATQQSRLATAVALTTGTPDLTGFVTATDTPSPTPTPTPGPTDTSTLTPTPVPTDTAVPTATPVPTNTPGPSPTPTWDPSIPTPTLTPLWIPISQIPPRKTSAPRPTLTFPQGLVGRILFQSSMIDGRARTYVMKSDGTEIGRLTQKFPYARAVARDAYSADRQFRAFALKSQEMGKKGRIQIFYEWHTYGTVHVTTQFGAGTAWQPSWSPTEDKIAFISNENGNDEIWVVERDKWPAIQLTHNKWEWDHHPSFSPDGTEIVFSSNRTGRRQIWLMNADGSNQRPITPFEWEAWNPVWVKYPDS